MTGAKLDWLVGRKKPRGIILVMAVVASGAGGCVADRAPNPRLAPTLPTVEDKDVAFSEDGDVPLAGDEISRPDALGQTVTEEALALTGTPYRLSGETPTGFDCSGFTRYLYGRQGIDLPRLARDQYEAGRSVEPVTDIRPGDLVFFSTVGPGPTHVGVVVDHDQFIHAPSARGVVRVERLDTSYWARRYVGARRLTGGDRAPSALDQ